MTFGGVLFVLALAALAIFIAGRNIYSEFDHSKWDEFAKPSLDAEIVRIYTEQVQYVKNGAKYKTTVSFSDGFKFITHETNRQDSLFTYQISVDESLKEKIVKNAIRAHKEAVEKFNKKK